MADELAERVLSMERRLAGLQMEVSCANARNFLGLQDSTFRLARVTNSPATGDNTFEIIFQDGTYTAEAGEQEAEYTPRQQTSRAVVHNIANEKIENGTYILVYWWSDRWWTFYKKPESTAGDEMWCALVCFWIEECCLYRGIVKRVLESDDYCAPSETSLAAWIVHSPDIDEGIEPDDPDYLRPQAVLSPNAVGWVRKISDSHVCTYDLPQTTDDITEDLPVFQWCYIQPRNCPTRQQTVTAKITVSDESCKDRVNAIGAVALTWVAYDDIPGPPTNLADCSTVEDYEHGAWIGEFQVPTTQPIRLFNVTYTVIVEGEPELIIGFARLHWCSGALVQLYINDNGDAVPETREWSDLEFVAGCYSPRDSQGNCEREDVTYEYRLLFVCIHDTGFKSLCVEHIHPSCHIWAGQALQDAGRGQEFVPLCANSHLVSIDGEFGYSPTVEGAVGYFYDGGPSQFALHRFAGCSNEVDIECEFEVPATRFRVTLTW